MRSDPNRRSAEEFAHHHEVSRMRCELANEKRRFRVAVLVHLTGIPEAYCKELRLATRTGLTLPQTYTELRLMEEDGLLDSELFEGPFADGGGNQRRYYRRAGRITGKV